MSASIDLLFPPPHPVPTLPAGGNQRSVPSSADIEYVVAQGILAPSGGNFQPWKFRYQNGCLRCQIDPQRTDYFTNYRDNEAYLSLGAALMNIELSSRALGFLPDIRYFPIATDRHIVCDIDFRAATPSLEAQALSKYIPYRVSSRRSGQRVPLPDQDQEGLAAIARQYNAQLLFLTQPEQLAKIGPLLGRLNHLGYLNKCSHQGIMKMLRWTDEEAASTRDGIPVKTFELSPLELTGLRFISSWQVFKFVNNMGAGRAIENLPVAWANSASAVCLLLMAMDKGPEAFVQAGRALEHLWLDATRRSLAFHVLGVNSYFDRLKHGGGEGFSHEELQVVLEVRAHYLQLFDISADTCEAVLFRIVPPNPLVERTYRRLLKDVLVIADTPAQN